MKRVMQIEQGQMKDQIPVFKSGDTVKVHVKIKEGDKERVQVFQGTVIGRRGSGTGATFTVRKITYGVGVERVFPLHSPNVSKIQRIRQGKVHQSKLYYLRDLTGKSARIEEKLEEKPAEQKASAEKAPKKGKKARKAAREAKPDMKAETKVTASVEETADVTPDASVEEKTDE